MNGGKVTLRRTAGLYLGAAVLRLALFTVFPGLPDLLTGRVEVSTPVTSFKRCKLCPLRPYTCLPMLTALCYATVQEGLFLYNHNVSPYDGGVYHQAPLFLPLFSLLPNSSGFPIFTYLLYIAVDLLSANALQKIADSGEAVSSALFTSPRREKRWSGLVIAAV
jgi:phosphatidylinositol glycan class U